MFTFWQRKWTVEKYIPSCVQQYTNTGLEKKITPSIACNS